MNLVAGYFLPVDGNYACHQKPNKATIISMGNLRFLLPIILLFTSCTGTPAPKNNVDLRFREFYDVQGGKEYLGEPVSGLLNEDGKQIQYTQNAIMVYNPQAPQEEMFNFLPVGSALMGSQPEDPPIKITGNDEQVVVNGHVIYEEFLPLYQRMGGMRFAGKPITEVRRNLEQGRFEQLFEKMGFYRRFADPTSNVHLLPYGLLACKQVSGASPCQGKVGYDLVKHWPPEPFLATVLRLGDEFTGKPISDAHLAPDNLLEQVYENIVLAAPPDNLRLVELRPVPALVNMRKDAPTQPRQETGLSFFPIGKDGLGYNVETMFLEYIVQHGGSEISGDPSSEVFEMNGMLRQCFVNYCMDYDPRAPSGAQVRPAPLGYDYLHRQGFQPPSLRLRVWETFPLISPGQSQIVNVMIYNETPGQPLRDVQPSIRWVLPDGQEQTAVLPPTQANGATYLKIETGNTAGIISYEVCVQWPGSEPECMSESWIVK